MDFDSTVKLAIYTTLAETTMAPTAAEVARQIGENEPDVLAAFQRLHQKRLLVPEPRDPSRIRMAPPFSGVTAPFLRAGSRYSS